MNNNVLYAQAGGVTAVINASGTGVIEMAKRHPEKFGTIYAAMNGIAGVLEENLVDVTQFSEEKLDRIRIQPGAAFEACRFDLDPLSENPAQYERVLQVLKAYKIGYFFYNGGNGSMVTAQKVADYCTDNGHPVVCIGVAKTIDNDLAMSHCSPGFGSAAKYIATSLLEATMDLYSMHNTSTRFFCLEAMGRDTGWLAIAGGLIKDLIPDVPLVVLPAETTFDQNTFLNKVAEYIDHQGYCVCIASEGIRNADGEYLSVANLEVTRFKTYTQLGGSASTLAKLVGDHFGCKTHYAVPDYLQRSASHIVSQTDWEMAYRAGKAAVQAAMDGEHGVLPVIEVIDTNPLIWRYKTVELTAVADEEKIVPGSFLTDDGMGVTEAGLEYLRPLIKGERIMPHKHGMPDIHPLKFNLVDKQLPVYKAIKS